MTTDEQLQLYKERFKDAWNALKVIRDAVEQHAPPGTLKNPEYLEPTFMHEAEELVRGIEAIASGRYQEGVPVGANLMHFEYMRDGERPQADIGLSYQPQEFGHDSMAISLLVKDSTGREALYVPMTVNGKVVRSNFYYSLSAGEDEGHAAPRSP